MHQNDTTTTTTSFSSNGQQVAPSQIGSGLLRNVGARPRCARCEREGAKQPRSCWCGAISTTVIVLLTLICIYLLYLVVFNTAGYGPPAASSRQTVHRQPGVLKLVSVISRHGDRAPAGDLPQGDDLAGKTIEFWPRGLGNLTDSGRFRMFRLGLELRKRYSHHLDFDAGHFLAFSSRKFRCKESLELTLRGLFQMDWTPGEGLELAEELARTNSSNHLPSGSGSPREYQQVAIDTQTVPSLSFGQVEFPCKYQREHASLKWNYDPTSQTSRSIREFKGVAGLERTLSARYKTGAQNISLSDVMDVCGTTRCELQLRRTSTSGALGRHYLEWVNRRAPEYAHANVSLFDLCDQASALYFDKCLEGTSDRLQLGPIVTSLITSQEAALQVHDKSESGTPKNGVTFDSRGLYASAARGTRKIVLYSTHDSVVQPLLSRLAIARPIANSDEYEKLFPTWGHADSDTTGKLLAGLGATEFGVSLVVELYEIGIPNPVGSVVDSSASQQTGGKSAYVQAALYNEVDPKYKPIEYRRLEFGRICRQLFQEQHPGSSADSFFMQASSSPWSSIDEILSCPFELFKNVTNHYLISTPEFNKLCAL